MYSKKMLLDMIKENAHILAIFRKAEPTYTEAVCYPHLDANDDVVFTVNGDYYSYTQEKFLSSKVAKDGAMLHLPDGNTVEFFVRAKVA